MKSHATAQFWKLYDALPEEIRRRADKSYALWQLNPQAHGLYFKRVGQKQPIYSVRIGKEYRSLGLLDGDTVIWFWIGSHGEYDRLLKGL